MVPAVTGCPSYVTFPVTLPDFEHPITPNRRTRERTTRGGRVRIFVVFIRSSFWIREGNWRTVRQAKELQQKARGNTTVGARTGSRPDGHVVQTVCASRRRAYQSGPSVSFPLGVLAANQVAGLMLLET